MRVALPLAVLGIVLLTLAPAVPAQHNSSLVFMGIATDATGGVYKLSGGFASTGSLPIVYGTFTFTLTGPAGGVVYSRSFFGGIEQVGVDPDPIPEAFYREMFPVDPAVDFAAQGAMAQWELQPLIWVHANTGTLDGYSIHFLSVRLANQFVQWPV